MSMHTRSTKPPVKPSYPQPRRAEKAVMAVIAVLLSSTLLGSMLSLFEMRAQETAMARTSVETQPSSHELAVRKIDSEPRG